MSVEVETNVGSIVINLFTEDAPLLCENFINLCILKYYNWCIFHRLEKDFIAQSGDPSGTGEGGVCAAHVLSPSSPSFMDATVDLTKSMVANSVCKHVGRGIVGMAVRNGGQVGSQFYIQLANRPLSYLDGKLAVFGRVQSDCLSVINLINNSFVDEENRPLEDIYIKHVKILFNPFIGNIQPPPSPPPTTVFLSNRRISRNEMANASDNEKEKERERERERLRKESESMALKLTLLGDRPTADTRPPQNVLFICRLNPITQPTDLITIFSRFGQVSTVDLVKDRMTGVPLGYGFVEFAEDGEGGREACEKAFRKMNNAIIDGRRIKVDFCQSVSKVRRQMENQSREYEASKNERNKRDYDSHRHRRRSERSKSPSHRRH